MTDAWIEEVKFDSRGLVPVVAQDSESGRVLMLAWADREALLEAVKTRRGGCISHVPGTASGGRARRAATFRSCSRCSDCDGDSVIYEVRRRRRRVATPGIRAASTGRLMKTASGRKTLRSSAIRTRCTVITEKRIVWKKKTAWSILEEIADTIDSRHGADPAKSYVLE